jgi:glycosyltransferase involved in cell wall biosynthesis
MTYNTLMAQETIYFLNHFPSTSMGGAEVVSRQLTSELQRRNFDVVWYGKPDKKYRDFPPPDSVQVRDIKSINIVGRPVINPCYLASFAQDLVREKPAQIIINSPTEESLLLMMACALLINGPDTIKPIFHGDPNPNTIHYPNTKKELIKRLLRPIKNYVVGNLSRIILNHPDVTPIAVSSSTAKRIQVLGLSEQPVKICYPPSGKHNPTCHSELKNLPTDRPLELTYVGRVTRGKGLETRLAPLASRLHDLQLPVQVSITGPSWDEVIKEEILKNSHGVIKFTGPKYGQELCEIYNRTHLQTLPSDSEGCPLVLAEGMTHGVPEIVTDIPSISEFMQPASITPGVLVSNTNLTEMIQTSTRFIEQILADPYLLPALSSAAIELSRLYDSDILTRNFVDTILN